MAVDADGGKRFALSLSPTLTLALPFSTSSVFKKAVKNYLRLYSELKQSYVNCRGSNPQDAKYFLCVHSFCLVFLISSRKSKKFVSQWAKRYTRRESERPNLSPPTASTAIFKRCFWLQLEKFVVIFIGPSHFWQCSHAFMALMRYRGLFFDGFF